MTDEPPKPWVYGSDEDLVACIAHALRHEGKRAICQADQLIAQTAAARILEAMKRAYVITPKAPTPLARADQHPKMGRDRERWRRREPADRPQPLQLASISQSCQS